MKKTAIYAQGLGERLFGDRRSFSESGAEILNLTLRRIVDGEKGYAFKDGDILVFDYLCRCCRLTACSLQNSLQKVEVAAAVAEADNTPEELSESAAVAYLQRRDRLEPFLAFVKEQKLKGKQRAHALGFPRYGVERWDVERIAKDLRVTAATIHRYRSQLRELLEEFEVLRAANGNP